MALNFEVCLTFSGVTVGIVVIVWTNLLKDWLIENPSYQWSRKEYRSAYWLGWHGKANSGIVTCKVMCTFESIEYLFSWKCIK